jgi:NTP pyrophosphatase (non-canonical NTP hydrolase)
MNHACEFRSKFHLPNSGRIHRSTQKNLIVEEFKEFLEAEQKMVGGIKESTTDCLKELADLVYVCYQFAAFMDWDLDQTMSRVHASNLSKLDDNGQPIYREDGKVLKGPNYQPPNLTDLV